MGSNWPATSVRACSVTSGRRKPVQSRAERTPAVIGGKAKQLVELQLAGFRVPDFLCSPPDIAKAIEILGVPLAVRSSASAEDGREVSFAGQFRSFLNLRTARERSEERRVGK